MANTKPFVALACFCEKVLEEKDGVLSAVRIVDIFTIPRVPEGAVGPDGLKGAFVLNGLISLRAGDVVGTGSVGLVMHKLDGSTLEISPPTGWPVALNGEDHGVNLKLQFPLGVRNFGLVWFDVLWNGEMLTRIPLRLKLAETDEQTTKSS